MSLEIVFESTTSRPRLKGMDFRQISVEELWLEHPFLEEEMIGALKSLYGVKVLGLVGMTALFQQCWGLLGRTSWVCFRHFMSHMML